MMVPELPPGTTIEQAHRIIVRHASDGGCGVCLDTHCPSADWALWVVVAEQAPPDDRRPVTTVARLVARAHLPHGGAPECRPCRRRGCPSIRAAAQWLHRVGDETARDVTRALEAVGVALDHPGPEAG